MLSFTFKLLSRLPFGVLYALSSFLSMILQHLIGYRRKIVEQNIRRSLPHLNISQQKKIASAFYLNFCDTWVETIKMFTISQEELRRRVTTNYKVFDEIKNEGMAGVALMGHQFNWEYANASLGVMQPLPLLTVYIPPTSDGFDALMKEIRSRFATQLIPASGLTQAIIPWRRKQYLLGLVADQSPADPTGAYWLQYLNQPTGFVTGPQRNIEVLGQVPVYLEISKPRRGYYHINAIRLTTSGEKEKGAVIKAFARAVEKTVFKYPELYLWSHKRWKHSWRPEYAERWIDSDFAQPS